jgi:hypothetical protein
MTKRPRESKPKQIDNTFHLYNQDLEDYFKDEEFEEKPSKIKEKAKQKDPLEKSKIDGITIFRDLFVSKVNEQFSSKLPNKKGLGEQLDKVYILQQFQSLQKDSKVKVSSSCTSKVKEKREEFLRILKEQFEKWWIPFWKANSKELNEKLQKFLKDMSNRNDFNTFHTRNLKEFEEEGEISPIEMEFSVDSLFQDDEKPKSLEVTPKQTNGIKLEEMKSTEAKKAKESQAIDLEILKNEVEKLKLLTQNLQKRLEQKDDELNHTQKDFQNTTQVLLEQINILEEEKDELEEKMNNSDETLIFLTEKYSFEQNALYLKPLLENAKEKRDFKPIDDFILILKEKLERMNKLGIQIKDTIEMVEIAIKTFKNEQNEIDKKVKEAKEREIKESVNYLLQFKKKDDHFEENVQ